MSHICKNPAEYFRLFSISKTKRKLKGDALLLSMVNGVGVVDTLWAFTHFGGTADADMYIDTLEMFSELGEFEGGRPP